MRLLFQKMQNNWIIPSKHITIIKLNDFFFQRIHFLAAILYAKLFHIWCSFVCFNHFSEISVRSNSLT